MTTFSQLIDDVVLEHLRPDLLVTITSYANQTIRELHSKPRDSAPLLFHSNRVELEYTTVAEPAVWEIPNVTRFQRLETAYLPVIGEYVRERSLSKLNDYDNYVKYAWYRSGPTIAFTNLVTGTEVQLAYFEFPRNLPYIAPASRTVTWSELTESFSFTGTPTDEQKETILALNTNWIIERWGEAVVKQGIRSKVFARLGDADRSRMAYSQYESMREQMQASELWQQNAL